MNSSAGIALRLLFLMIVVFGMPLLAIPLVWEAPASRLRPAAPRIHSSSSGTGAYNDAEVAGVDGFAEPRSANATHDWNALGLSGDSLTTPQKISRKLNSGRPHHKGEITPTKESSELARLALSSNLQRRLEELGAEYLVLERLEVSGLYRCVCLVDVPGTSYQRPFEAADILPERAVQRVLEELANWRLAVGGLEATAPRVH